jgi:hypothetical protein
MRQRKKDIFAPCGVEKARDPAVRTPALFALPGGKDLSFCVQGSFERAVFRSGKIKTAGNTGYVFPAVFLKYGRKRAAQDLSSPCARAPKVMPFHFLANFRRASALVLPVFADVDPRREA